MTFSFNFCISSLKVFLSIPKFVTASIVDCHILARGSQEKVFGNITWKDREKCPDLIVLTPTCTSSILQEDLQNFVNKTSITSYSDVIFIDVNHYRVNELQAANRTLEQVVQYYLDKACKQEILDRSITDKPFTNIIGIFTLGFHNQRDCR
jgi:light-independent protochlorophyllide reductase subunit B